MGLTTYDKLNQFEKENRKLKQQHAKLVAAAKQLVDDNYFGDLPPKERDAIARIATVLDELDNTT